MNRAAERPECSGCRAADPSREALAPMSADMGIGRRTFLVQSGLLAAMAALAACGVASNSTAPSVPANSVIDVANYPALANVGGVAVLTLSGAPLAIVRTSTTSFLALSRVCPHQGGIVNLSGTEFVCPVHGATFNEDGTWIGGQRTSNLNQYSTSYDATANTLTIS